MKKIILFIFIALFVIVGVIFMNKSSDIKVETSSEMKKKENINTKKEVLKKDDNKKIKVDIKGNVVNPNVYEVDSNSRVIDIVNIAGGFTENADTDSINLSKIVNDEDVIIIYSKDEMDNCKRDYLEKIEYCSKDNNDACASSIVTFDDKTNSSSNINNIININTATLDELMTLTGIGESKAKSIIEYRNNNGNFNTIDDIKNVTGIGDSIFDKIKDHITV